jgi:hypothetical protein
MEGPLYDHIEAYIRRELAPEAQAAFEEAMRTDAALQDAVAEHRVLMDHLEALRLRQKVAQNLSPAVEKRRMPPLLLLITGAALVAISIFLIRVRGKQHPNPTAPEIPVLDQPSGSPAPAPEIQPEKAQDQRASPLKKHPLVADPRFAAALRTLESMDGTPMGLDDVDAQKREHLSRIIGLLRAHQPEQALTHIGAFPDVTDPEYTEDLEWLQAVALLGTQPESGLQALQTIAASPHHAYRRKAILLLESIQ